MGLGQNLLDTPTLRSGAYVRPRGAWAANTAYSVDDQVTADNAVWNCITAHTSGGTFTGTDWTLAAPVSLTQTITTSQDVTAPIWATVANVKLTGAGGGGGGGGSASASGNLQTGGSGGGCAQEVNATIAVAGGQSYPIVIAAGGAGGAGGAANGNAGENAHFGASSTALGLTAAGGGAGIGSGVGSSFVGVAGNPAEPNSDSLPSANNNAQLGQGWKTNGNGLTMGALGNVIGGAGGSSTGGATNEYGGAGGPVASTYPAPSITLGAAPIMSGSAGGTPNQAAYGCGGGGGGGGAYGGAGGAGGVGGNGICIIEWRSQ